MLVPIAEERALPTGKGAEGGGCGVTLTIMMSRLWHRTRVEPWAVSQRMIPGQELSVNLFSATWRDVRQGHCH